MSRFLLRSVNILTLLSVKIIIYPVNCDIQCKRNLAVLNSFVLNNKYIFKLIVISKVTIDNEIGLYADQIYPRITQMIECSTGSFMHAEFRS